MAVVPRSQYRSNGHVHLVEMGLVDCPQLISDAKLTHVLVVVVNHCGHCQEFRGIFAEQFASSGTIGRSETGTLSSLLHFVIIVNLLYCGEHLYCGIFNASQCQNHLAAHTCKQAVPLKIITHVSCNISSFGNSPEFELIAATVSMSLSRSKAKPLICEKILSLYTTNVLYDGNPSNEPQLPGRVRSVRYTSDTLAMAYLLSAGRQRMCIRSDKKPIFFNRSR